MFLGGRSRTLPKGPRSGHPAADRFAIVGKLPTESCLEIALLDRTNHDVPEETSGEHVNEDER